MLCDSIHYLTVFFPSPSNISRMLSDCFQFTACFKGSTACLTAKCWWTHTNSFSLNTSNNNSGFSHSLQLYLLQQTDFYCHRSGNHYLPLLNLNPRVQDVALTAPVSLYNILSIFQLKIYEQKYIFIYSHYTLPGRDSQMYLIYHALLKHSM